MDNDTAVATPRPGSIFGLREGQPLTQTHPTDYPLGASCTHCGQIIRCADGSADWVHNGSRQIRCEATWTTTEELYELADAIEAVVDATPDRWFNPSQIARKIRATTHDTAEALRWMDEHKYIKADGNGCWRKYASRRTTDGSWKA